MRVWLLALALCLPATAAERRSGLDDMAPANRAMQQDDAANPGMLWVVEGEALWEVRCAHCHGQPAAMRGVAPRYPAWDEATAAPIDLAGRIAAHSPMPRESPPLLALTTFVAHQSRGLPIAPSDDSRLAPALIRGAASYAQRRGQLDLSCAQCHDDHAGRRLAGSVIPQAHPTGYPLYRLEWQTVGSLQRRLRGCMTGVRSEPFAYGAVEYIEIELFLMRRAAGMEIETPAVRP